MTIYLQDVTDRQIIAYAKTLGYTFDKKDAQNVRNTACAWWGTEILQDAVQDYINAFGG